MADAKKPFPFQKKGAPGEDAGDERRKRMNKGKLPGLEKMPMAAMKKGRK